MNCREIIEFLMDYCDGELPEHVQACFEMHLQVCPPCETYLKTYRETILIAKRCVCENPASACDEIPEPLIKAILAARKSG